MLGRHGCDDAAARCWGSGWKGVRWLRYAVLHGLAGRAWETNAWTTRVRRLRYAVLRDLAGRKGTSWSRDVTPPLRDVKKTDIFGRLKCLLPCVKCLKAHDKWRQCGTLPLACPLELGTRNTDPGNSSSKLASGWPILNKPRTESMIMSIAGPFAVWPPCPSRQILMVS